MIYLIGSLHNGTIPELANVLREAGYEVFDDWHSPGPDTDTYWQSYEQYRGRSYTEALSGKHAWNVFEYDRRNLLAADVAVLVLPAGKSAHLELGYCAGKGKLTCILLDGEPEKWDVMYRFADKVVNNRDELLEYLRAYENRHDKPTPALCPLEDRADPLHSGERPGLVTGKHYQILDEVRRQEWPGRFAEGTPVSGPVDREDGQQSNLVAWANGEWLHGLTYRGNVDLRGQ